MRSVSLVLPLVISLAGCEKVTEIVVAMDTDLEIPAQIDAIGLQVARGDEDLVYKTWEVDLNRPNAIKLPATVGLLPGEDMLTPILVTVTGYRLAKRAITRQARVTFVPERTLLLGTATIVMIHVVDWLPNGLFTNLAYFLTGGLWSASRALAQGRSARPRRRRQRGSSGCC